MTDVLIAGGGVAGASLAIQLGRRGLKVRLFEKAYFPREKVCGEGVMPAGVEALQRLGVKAPFQPFRGVRYWRGAEMAGATFPKGHGAGMRRKHLDAALLEKAATVAEVREGSAVDGVIQENGRIAGFRVKGEEHRARLVVAADGVHSPLRRMAGIQSYHGPRRLALRAHYELNSTPWVEVFWGDGLEIYLTPLANGETGVVAMTEPRRYMGDAESTFLHAAASQPVLSERVASARRINGVAGAACWHVEPKVRTLPGFVLLGDAAGYIDPITGGGITQALLAAELLADHLRDEIPESLMEFDLERQRMLREYRVLTRAALWLTNARWPSIASFHILQRWPVVFSHLLGVAGGAA